MLAGDSLHDRLTALAVAEPALADALALRGAIIELIDHITCRWASFVPRPTSCGPGWRRGFRCSQQLALPVPPSVVTLLERLHSSVAMLTEPSMRGPAEALLQAIRSHGLHSEQLIAESIVGHADHLERLAEAAGVATSLVDPVSEPGRPRPLLAAVAERLAPALALQSWTRGYCPICSRRPILAERHGGSVGGPSARLRCGRCADRLALGLGGPSLPACADGDLEAVASIPVYNIGTWDLFGCRICHSAVKRADGPRSERLAHLLLDDLATWRLDQEAWRQVCRGRPGAATVLSMPMSPSPSTTTTDGRAS